MKNRVQLIGNIGKVPEKTATTKDGKSVVRFAIAQDVNGLDVETQKFVKKDSQWFQISCFANVAERALTLAKGELVAVSGELRSRNYQTESGEKRTSVEVVAYEILRVERVKKSADTSGVSA